MNGRLQAALTGSSLKQNILNTLSHQQIQTISHFLQRQHPHQPNHHHSLHTFGQEPTHSPNIRRKLYSQGFSPSPPSHAPSNSSHGSEKLGRTQRLQRSGRYRRSQNLSKKSATEDEFFGNPFQLETSKRARRWNQFSNCTSCSRKRYGSPDTPNIDRSRSGKHSRSGSGHQRHSSSREGVASKINLSSILQQQSSEDYPREESHSSAYRSRDRRGNQVRAERRVQGGQMREVVKKRLHRCIKQPQILHRLFKNEYLCVRFRIQRRNILELELHSLRPIDEMKVMLRSGNLECQHVEQDYQGVKPNVKFYLFSSVRTLDIDNIYELPRLTVQILSHPNTLAHRQSATLPYTWLHFSAESRPRLPRSRIKTKICLERLRIRASSLRNLSLVLPQWHSRLLGRQLVYESGFRVEECEFELSLREERGGWSVELGGRGQERMIRMVSFLCEFLC